MKDKYENLSDFISDILEAAEQASKNIVEDIKKQEESKNTPKVEVKPQVEEQKTKNTDVKCTKEGSIMDNKGRFISSNGALKCMPPNITIDNNDHYILNEMVNGWPTYNEQHIIFEQVTEEGYKVPGITENQILAVLYNRYKNNPKKLDLVRQLMN